MDEIGLMCDDFCLMDMLLRVARNFTLQTFIQGSYNEDRLIVESEMHGPGRIFRCAWRSG